MAGAIPRSVGDDQIRRRAQRTGFQKRTQIHLLRANPNQSAIAVELLDYSGVGIGFVSQVSLERGQQFWMRLTPRDKPPVDMLYTVAYCSSTPNKEFRIGAEFVCTLLDAKSPEILPDSKVLKDRIRRAMLT